MNVMVRGEAKRVKAAETSANFFQLLGTQAMLGRMFAGDDDAGGRVTVAVVSHAFWQRVGGGPEDLESTPLHVNGVPVVVIGVAPPRFDYPGKTDIWIPTVFDVERVPKRGAILFQTIGRLKPGVDLDEARSLMRSEILAARTAGVGTSEAPLGEMVRLRDQLAGSVRQASWILAGLILLVLLAACANVAQLLLARGTERQREFATRASLGASRARLLQQLVTESMALTMISAALGLVVAHWVVDIARSVIPAQLAAQTYTVMEWRVLGFAIVLALLTGAVFGVLAVSAAGPIPVLASMAGSGVPVPERRRKAMRAGVAALQAALTLILVVSAATMGRAFLKLLKTDLGLSPGNVVTLSVSLQGSKYRTGEAEWKYYREALERLRAVPGVEAAGAVSYLPLANHLYMADSFQLDSGETVKQIVTNATMPGYFGAIGTRLVAGRDFRTNERQTGEPAVIVNEAFAQASGLGRAVVGRRLKAQWSETPYLIVGVVATTRLAGPAHPGGPQVFWPVEEEPPQALTFVARVRGPAEEKLAACGTAIRTVDPQVPVFDLQTLDDRLSGVLARPTFFTTAIALLAGLALVLAAVGTFGGAACTVAQRTHEIGLRVALGASYAGVRALVVRESLAPMAVGALVGMGGAVATGKFLEHLVVSAEATDVWTCSAVALVLLAGGFLAAWSASTRVLAVSPSEALRTE